MKHVIFATVLSLTIPACGNGSGPKDVTTPIGDVAADAEGTVQPEDVIELRRDAGTDWTPDACVPDCDGKQCGDDGCGGSCGQCPFPQKCVGGQCLPPDCLDTAELDGGFTKACAGEEDCITDICIPIPQGGSICTCFCVDDCPPGFECKAIVLNVDVVYVCVPECQPACIGMQCGPDGCGDVCGQCEEGYECQDGKCVGQGECGDGICVPELDEDCVTCPGDCACPDGDKCLVDGACCTPWCDGKACGSDGCYGNCGECEADSICSANECVAKQDVGTIKWKFETGGGIWSTPALADDGTVYVGSKDGFVYAVKADGTLKWKFETGHEIFSSPAIGADGTIYVGSQNKHLYALDQEGNELWQFETGHYVNGTAAIDHDGKIYITSWDKSIYCLDAQGSQLWSYETLGATASSPAIDWEMKTLYFGSGGGNYYALTTQGALVWKFQTGDKVYSSAIGVDRSVFFGSNDENLYGVDVQGDEMWKFKTGGHVNSSPVVDKDFNLLFGSGDHHLYVVTPKGKLKWKYETGDYIEATPALGDDGIIYVGSWDDNLYAISAGGGFVFKVKTGDNVYGSATIGYDGTLYFGSYDGFLYAVTISSTAPADSYWPLFHHDSKNTGIHTEDGKLPW